MSFHRLAPLTCALLLTGCGLFYDGPSDEDAVRVARAQMVANAPSPAHAAAAQAAKLETDDCVITENEKIYSCTVDVTITFNGEEAEQQFVVQLKRTGEKTWALADSVADVASERRR